MQLQWEPRWIASAKRQFEEVHNTYYKPEMLVGGGLSSGSHSVRGLSHLTAVSSLVLCLHWTIDDGDDLAFTFGDPVSRIAA